MKALPPTGLVDFPRPVHRQWKSASPTRPAVNKSTRFCSCLSLVSDQSLLHSRTWSVLDRVLTRTATTDSPARPGYPSEATGDRVCPAAQPAARSGNCVRRAERAERATSSRRSCQRASAASSPDRSAGAHRGPHAVDSQQRGLALDLEGRAHGPTGREAPHWRCCAVSSRWSL